MSDHPDPNATAAYRPAPPAGERFIPGVLLANRYRVVAPLGVGGMGEVYRADDLTLGQPVALKFLLPEALGNPEAVARFVRETDPPEEVKIALEDGARRDPTVPF